MDAHRNMVWLLAFWLAASVAWADAPQSPPDDAESAFRNAFADGVGPAEQTEFLERVIKEQPECRWADDALWVLGESARQRRSPRRVAYYWQYLMARHPDVELEKFTKALPVYRMSRLPPIALYMEAMGLTYVSDGAVDASAEGGLVNARPFNPVPMAVWEGLARAYQDLGRPALALRAYRRALAAVPAEGTWSRSYQAAIERLEKRVEEQASRKAADAGRTRPGTAPPDGAEGPTEDAQGGEPREDQPATEPEGA